MFVLIIRSYLQTHNNRNLNVKVLGSIHNALSDDVTPHDTTEDVYQYSGHVGIRQDDFEGFLQLEITAWTILT